MDVDIEFGGVRVSTGDLVVADWDGVTIVPRAIASDAIEKAGLENVARELLLASGKMTDVCGRSFEFYKSSGSAPACGGA